MCIFNIVFLTTHWHYLNICWLSSHITIWGMHVSYSLSNILITYTRCLLSLSINFFRVECHDHDTRSTLHHSVWSCPCNYHPFHCMYLWFLIISILLVSPPIGECFVHSVSPYNYLICFHLQSPVTLYSHPVLLTNMIHLKEPVTYIIRLTHRTARLCSLLFVGIPNPPSIALYILL